MAKGGGPVGDGVVVGGEAGEFNCVQRMGQERESTFRHPPSSASIT
jgi:hypothetical protein